MLEYKVENYDKNTCFGGVMYNAFFTKVLDDNLLDTMSSYLSLYLLLYVKVLDKSSI